MSTFCWFADGGGILNNLGPRGIAGVLKRKSSRVVGFGSSSSQTSVGRDDGNAIRLSLASRESDGDTIRVPTNLSLLGRYVS